VPKPKWHDRVINAIIEMGTDREFEAQSGIVYYKVRKNRFEYHPDVLWLYDDGNRFKPSAVVWEIESGWDNKRIAGDSILAFMMLPDYTTFFKEKDQTKFGRVLKKDMVVTTYYGKRRATYYRDYHRMMNLNSTLVILIMQHKGYEDYWKRYINSIADYIGFKGNCDVISIPKSCDSVSYVKHRLAHLESLRRFI